MVTLILKASQRATKELEQGVFKNATIESEKGKILFSEVKGNIICIITTVDCKIGIVNLKLAAASSAIQDLV